MDLNVGTEEMYDALFVGSTNLQRSVRSFYKLYDALFACSRKMDV